MLKTCKHSNCAICKEISEREIFESIFQKKNPETFLCEHALYKITNSDGKEWVIPSLEYIYKGMKGYYFVKESTLDIIKLKYNNFQVLCSKQGECEQDPFVSVYVPKQKEAAE